MTITLRAVAPLSLLAALAGLAGCNDGSVVAAARCTSGSTHSAMTTPPDAVAAGSQALLDAMDVTSTLAIANQTASAVALGDTPKQAAAYAGLGAIQPLNGATFAWLSTGYAGAGTPKALDPFAFSPQSGADLGGAACSDVAGTHDCVRLAFTFVAPTDANSVLFDFDFLSTEYPEWVGSGFNDSFTVSLASPSFNYSNLVYDQNGAAINVDNVFFNQPCSAMSGTGFQITEPFSTACDAGSTGLLTTTAPVAPGETVTMVFEIYDATDGVYDSAVMIDNFRFDSTPVGTPNTGTPTPTPAVSPTPTPAPTETATPAPTPACS